MDIQKTDKEICDLENEIAQLVNIHKRKGLFESVFEKSRELLLNARLRTKQMLRKRVYERVGKSVCDSDFQEQMQNSELDKVMSPVRMHREAIRQMKEKEQSLSESKERILGELRALNVREGTQRTMRLLENQTKKIEDEVKIYYLILGNLFIEHQLKDKVSDSAVNACCERIMRLKKENENIEQRVKRLEAAIEVDRIEESMTDTNVRIERVKAEIMRLNDELESLNQQLEQLKDEKKDKLKIRGSEKTLLNQA